MEGIEFAAFAAAEANTVAATAALEAATAATVVASATTLAEAADASRALSISTSIAVTAAATAAAAAEALAQIVARAAEIGEELLAGGTAAAAWAKRAYRLTSTIFGLVTSTFSLAFPSSAPGNWLVYF